MKQMCRFPHQDFMSSFSPLLKTSGSFTMTRHPKVHVSFLASYPGLPHGLGTRLGSFPTLRFNVVVRLSINIKPCYQATCTCILASFPGICHCNVVTEGNTLKFVSHK